MVSAKKNNKSEISIEIADLTKLRGNKNYAKKLFVLILSEINKQAYNNKQLTRESITFSLQRLIDLGMYKTPRTARRGFLEGTSILRSLKLKGSTTPYGSNKSSVSAQETLFTGRDIYNGQCIVYLNERIDWSFLIASFTIIPYYYFALPSGASDLLYYIFYLARQNMNEECGFTISLRAIHARLQLPAERGLNNPKRDIKKRIEEAVNCILEHDKSGEIELALNVNDELNISGYLDTGYLKIKLSGGNAEYFKRLPANFSFKGIQTKPKPNRE